MVTQLKMERVRFSGKGKQRDFLKKVIYNLDAPSLRELINYGLDVTYSSLKSYYSEFRLLPKNLFLDLCKLSKIDPSLLGVTYLGSFWGQIKGGKKSKRKK